MSKTVFGGRYVEGKLRGKGVGGGPSERREYQKGESQRGFSDRITQQPGAEEKWGQGNRVQKDRNNEA